MNQGATRDGRVSKPVRQRRIRFTRDSILFALGCGILLHETVISQLERPQTLLVGLALAAGPKFLRMDEARRMPPGHGEESPASTRSQPSPAPSPPPPTPPSGSLVADE